MLQAKLEPGFGLSYSDFYSTQGLERVDAAFLAYVAEHTGDIHSRLLAARLDPGTLDEKAHSALLVDAGPWLEDFIAELFQIRGEVAHLSNNHHRLAPLYSCRRLFVQRQVGKVRDRDGIGQLDGDALVARLAPLLGHSPETPDSPCIDELAFAEAVLGWMDAADENAETLQLARDYTAWVLHTEAGRARHKGSDLFVLPEKIDLLKLVPVEIEQRNGVAMITGPAARRRSRDGFSLTDEGMGLAKCIGRGALLHLVPQPSQRLLCQGS